MTPPSEQHNVASTNSDLLPSCWATIAALPDARSLRHGRGRVVVNHHRSLLQPLTSSLRRRRRCLSENFEQLRSFLLHESCGHSGTAHLRRGSSLVGSKPHDVSSARCLLVIAILTPFALEHFGAQAMVGHGDLESR